MKQKPQKRIKLSLKNFLEKQTPSKLPNPSLSEFSFS